jgi:hypothetical protein
MLFSATRMFVNSFNLNLKVSPLWRDMQIELYAAVLS